MYLFTFYHYHYLYYECTYLLTYSTLSMDQNGTADAASMFADDIYAAGLCHGLELAAGESHNGEGK